MVVVGTTIQISAMTLSNNSYSQVVCYVVTEGKGLEIGEREYTYIRQLFAIVLFAIVLISRLSTQPTPDNTKAATFPLRNSTDLSLGTSSL